MKKFLKYFAFGFLGLILLMGVAYGAISAVVSSRLNKSYDVKIGDFPIPVGQAAIEEGHRLFKARGCADCHGDDLKGKLVIDNPALGVIMGANLTTGKGGLLADYSNADFVRAIRHGVKNDGKPILFMPAKDYHGLSDEEVGNLVAYIRSVNPIDFTPKPSRLGPVMKTMYILGKVPAISAELIDHKDSGPKIVDSSSKEALGKYLINTCIGCHGQGLSGGHVPGTPPSFPNAANISQAPDGIKNWTKADFYRAMREGKRPDGRTLNTFMPWENFTKMTDAELDALWDYLQKVPAKTTGTF